jgi:hypothetical protein
MVAVPREPTEAMRVAGAQSIRDSVRGGDAYSRSWSADCWNAMHAATRPQDGAGEEAKP